MQQRPTKRARRAVPALRIGWLFFKTLPADVARIIVEEIFPNGNSTDATMDAGDQARTALTLLRLGGGFAEAAAPRFESWIEGGISPNERYSG